MIIDCDGCRVRGDACADCVVGVLLGMPGIRDAPDGGPPGAPIMQFDAPEQRALDVLADQGLVPRLRLVAGPPRRASGNDHGTEVVRDVG